MLKTSICIGMQASLLINSPPHFHQAIFPEKSWIHAHIYCLKILSSFGTILSQSQRSFRKMLGASSCIGGQLTDTNHKPSRENNLSIDGDDNDFLTVLKPGGVHDIIKEDNKSVSFVRV